jgi:hypothetical protein
VLAAQLLRALEIEMVFNLALELTTVGVGMKEHAKPIAERVDERHERRGEWVRISRERARARWPTRRDRIRSALRPNCFRPAAVMV